MKMTVLWDIPQCSVIRTGRPDDGGNRYMSNVGQLLQDYTAQNLRRLLPSKKFLFM